jgi:hypothetical protein
MLIRKYNIGPTLTDILSASGAAQGALPGLLELLVSFRLQKPGLMEVSLYSCELCRLTDMGKQWFQLRRQVNAMTITPMGNMMTVHLSGS